jgi:UrcA family protein
MQHAFAWRATALAALALSTTPALAQSAASDAEQHSMAVHYHDLDLATAKGRARLEMRLERAAAMVCGNPDGQRPWHGDDAAQTCYDNALAHARTTLAAAQNTREVVTR